MDDLLATSERIPDERRTYAILHAFLGETHDLVRRLFPIKQSVDRQTESGFDNQPITRDDFRFLSAQRFAQLDIAGVNKPLTPVIYEQLCGSQDMTCWKRRE